MKTTLTFIETLPYPDSPAGIVIPVNLSYRGVTNQALAKVDPGAEVCLFKHELGIKLGIQVEQGMPASLES